VLVGSSLVDEVSPTVVVEDSDSAVVEDSWVVEVDGS
jgi:hypothetical protein